MEIDQITELCRKSTDMDWVLVIIAGLFEVSFTFCLTKAQQITDTNEKIMWYAGFGLSLIISMGLLIKVARTLPMGTVYAVWTGIGAAGTVVVGIFVFNEPATFWRMFFIVALIGSVIGLKAVSH